MAESQKRSAWAYDTVSPTQDGRSRQRAQAGQAPPTGAGRTGAADRRLQRRRDGQPRLQRWREQQPRLQGRREQHPRLQSRRDGQTGRTRAAAADGTNAGNRRGRDERGQQLRTGRTRAAAADGTNAGSRERDQTGESPATDSTQLIPTTYRAVPSDSVVTSSTSTLPSSPSTLPSSPPPPSPAPPPPPPSLVMADEPLSLELASIDKLELLNGTTAVNWVSFEESLFTLPPTPPPLPGSSPPDAPPLPTEPAPQAPILGAWEDDPDRWARTLNKYNKERDDYVIKGRAHAAAVAAHEAATVKLAEFKAISEA
ncbi:unnamed protein product [Closterium sp. NIES-53]